MKRLALITAWLSLCTSSPAQKKENTVYFVEQQMELQAENDEAAIPDDYHLQQLEHYLHHPLNLNEADEDDLKELFLLNDLQIRHFLDYRRLLGKLISIYELQAIPGWDIRLIQGMLPYISVSENKTALRSIRERYRGGEHTLLASAARILQRSAGYLPRADGSRYYTGGPCKLNLRYTYKYNNLLQWGVLGSKDAGEPFFSSERKDGFDFYSFHFFLRRSGMIKSLALGDFTVNMGQGLLQWQSLAFTKSADITNIQRQSPVLRPYSAAGEYNFQRGFGITLQKGSWESTAFVSLKKVSGNMDTDTAQGDGNISSLLLSGYHRTVSELQDRNNVRQLAAGANIRYSKSNWHIGANLVSYSFSLPIKKEAAPYNLFAIKGSGFTNAGFDFSYTYKNMHWFGEAAFDRQGRKAFLQGLLLTPDPALDVSMVMRLIDKDYQAINANAFTENTAPSNERGLYSGITFRPSSVISLHAYADVFLFPWLKYRVDAPSYGKEYFIQVNYNPAKEVEVYSRFRSNQQQANRVVPGLAVKAVDLIPKQDWRVQCNLKVHPAVTLQNRFEAAWYDKTGPLKEEGFMAFLDLLYKPPLQSFGGNFRLLYFETEGYNSRIYAFERDVLYGYSVPAYYGKGFKYYLNLNYDLPAILTRRRSNPVKTTCWLKFASAVYPGKAAIGSGPDEIVGHAKTEIKLQLRFTYK